MAPPATNGILDGDPGQLQRAKVRGAASPHLVARPWSELIASRRRKPRHWGLAQIVCIVNGSQRGQKCPRSAPYSLAANISRLLNQSAHGSSGNSSSWRTKLVAGSGAALYNGDVVPGDTITGESELIPWPGVKTSTAFCGNGPTSRARSARVVRAADGREVLQMRVEMGLLQLEIDGRPDGQRPGGADSYFDYLVKIAAKAGDHFELSPEQCTEADREFMQFYHRRVCWLALREFRRAAADADHTLADDGLRARPFSG